MNHVDVSGTKASILRFNARTNVSFTSEMWIKLTLMFKYHNRLLHMLDYQISFFQIVLLIIG